MVVINPRALRDFTLPDTTSSQTSTVRLPVNVNNFEIKTSLIHTV